MCSLHLKPTCTCHQIIVVEIISTIMMFFSLIVPLYAAGPPAIRFLQKAVLCFFSTHMACAARYQSCHLTKKCSFNSNVWHVKVAQCT